MHEQKSKSGTRRYQTVHREREICWNISVHHWLLLHLLHMFHVFPIHASWNGTTENETLSTSKNSLISLLVLKISIERNFFSVNYWVCYFCNKNIWFYHSDDTDRITSKFGQYFSKLCLIGRSLDKTNFFASPPQNCGNDPSLRSGLKTMKIRNSAL